MKVGEQVTWWELKPKGKSYSARWMHECPIGTALRDSDSATFVRVADNKWEAVGTDLVYNNEAVLECWPLQLLVPFK